MGMCIMGWQRCDGQQHCPDGTDELICGNIYCFYLNPNSIPTVADPGGAEGVMTPHPVKISHEKDDHQRQPHRLHVSHPPLPGRWIRYWPTPFKSYTQSLIFLRLKHALRVDIFSCVQFFRLSIRPVSVL